MFQTFATVLIQTKLQGWGINRQIILVIFTILPFYIRSQYLRIDYLYKPLYNFNYDHYFLNMFYHYYIQLHALEPQLYTNRKQSSVSLISFETSNGASLKRERVWQNCRSGVFSINKKKSCSFDTEWAASIKKCRQLLVLHSKHKQLPLWKMIVTLVKVKGKHYARNCSGENHIIPSHLSNM